MKSNAMRAGYQGKTDEMREAADKLNKMSHGGLAKTPSKKTVKSSRKMGCKKKP